MGPKLPITEGGSFSHNNHMGGGIYFSLFLRSCTNANDQGQTLVRLSNDSVLDEDEIFRFITFLWRETRRDTQSVCVCVCV
jgi:hypothetical protein